MLLPETNWLPLTDAFRNNKLEFGFNLTQLKQLFNGFNLTGVLTFLDMGKDSILTALILNSGICVIGTWSRLKAAIPYSLSPSGILTFVLDFLDLKAF